MPTFPAGGMIAGLRLRMGRAAALLVAAAIAGCAMPSGPAESRAPFLALTSFRDQPAQSRQETDSGFALVAVHSPAAEPIRVTRLELSLQRGQTVWEAPAWFGDEVFGPGVSKTFDLAVRPRFSGSARMAIDASAPVTLRSWRIVYFDADGVRRSSGE